jgi:hypothetical protein
MEHQQIAARYETPTLEAFTMRWKILLVSRSVAPSFSKPRTPFTAISSLTSFSSGTKNALSIPPPQGLLYGPLDYYQFVEVLPCIEAHCFAHLV